MAVDVSIPRVVRGKFGEDEWALNRIIALIWLIDTTTLKEKTDSLWPGLTMMLLESLQTDWFNGIAHYGLQMADRSTQLNDWQTKVPKICLESFL